MAALSNDPTPSLLAQARRRVRMKALLMLHAAAFVAVSAGMLAINLLTSPAVPWFWFPFFGWLLGLTSHASIVAYLLSDRAEHAVRRELALLQQRAG